MPKYLITTPHSSEFIPPELNQRILSSEHDIRNSCDVGTELIAGGVKGALDSSFFGAVHKANINRLTVDLNRIPTGSSKNGVYRDRDMAGNPIYKPGKELVAGEKFKMLETYYYPWHNQFDRYLSTEPLRLHLDLHNVVFNRKIKKAKFGDFCDVDLGIRSEPDSFTPHDKEGLTFPRGEVEGLIESVTKHFGDFFEETLKRDKGELRVGLSRVYRGGYNVVKGRDRGNFENGTPRSFQIEFVREYGTGANGLPDAQKIAALSKVVAKIVDDILTNTLKQ
ncbi:hypothetical protein GF340_05120 [Candidatus Peregrinibacteria bacterium]|nr:hypothetical protein [Candidatus Peregrinibacteria bacterium]